MNLILLLIVIAQVCLGLCCWLSPEALRFLAAHLLTRADVIESARREQACRLQFWQLELGLGDAPSEGVVRAEAVVPNR